MIKGFDVSGITHTYGDMNLAPEFSTSSTYNVGDYVIYDLNGTTATLYRCKVAVTSAGGWTGSTNWEEVKVSSEVSNLKSALNTSGLSWNIIPFNYYSGADYTHKGIHFVKNNDGSVSSSGTSSGSARYYWCYDYEIPAGTYIIGGVPDGASHSSFWLEYIVNDDTTKIANSVEVTISDGDSIYLRTNYANEYVDTGHTWNVYIRKKSSDVNNNNDYSPFTFVPQIKNLITNVESIESNIENVESELNVLNDSINSNVSYETLGMTPLYFDWESGGITSSGETEDNTRIRTTGYFELINDFVAICDSGYQIACRKYSFDGTDYVDEGTVSSWASFLESTRNLIACHYVRFAIKKIDNSIITPDEHTHIKLLGFNAGTNTYFENINFHNVCHRGFSVVAPENTLPAFEFAKKVGFFYIETDVQFTLPDTNNPNGVPVILHDTSINRTARNLDGTSISNTIYINEITYEQALNYDFGVWKNVIYSGTKIPTFEQLIKWCKYSGVKPYIEIKSTANTQEKINILIEIAKKYGMLDQCTWICFTYSLLEMVHTAYSEARIGYLVSDKITATDVTDLLAIRDNNEVFFLPYNSHGNVDTSTFTLAIAEHIKIEACVIDNDTLFANMDGAYCGNVTNGYPTNRKMWESANTLI